MRAGESPTLQVSNLLHGLDPFVPKYSSLSQEDDFISAFEAEIS